MATKTKDELVQELFEVVKQKKAEIAKAEKPKWETNCSFSYNETSSERINIQTVSDVSGLLRILGHIVIQHDGFTQAGGMANVTDVPFKWQGFTLKEWVSDIQTRINKIQITKKKAELEDLEKRLDKLVSPEVREAMELAAIQKALA